MIGPIITLYTQPSCLPCKRVARKLEEAGVEFEIVDIAADQDAWAYVITDLGAKSTPVIEAEGFGVIRGYQPDKLKQLIDWWNEDCLEIDGDLIHDYVYEGDE